MKITRRQIRRLIREWFSDEHDPVTGERDQYEPDDQRMQQVQDEIYDLASREAGVSLPDIEDRFGGMGIDAAMQAEENGLVFMEDEVFYAGGAHELSAGPGGTRSYMGEGKITKRQLKRIIKEAMVETDPQEVADILWSYMDGDRTRRPYTFGELLEIASGEAGQNVSAYIEPAIEILVNDGVLAREGNAYYNSVGSSLGESTKITRRQLRRIIGEALELDWMDDIDAADVVDIIAKHDTYQGKQAGEALMNGMSVGDIINQLPGYLKGTITSELESFGSSPSASAVGDEGDEGPPAGAHSEYTIPGMATNKNAASVTVYDDEGNSVDEYTISLHPDYGNPGYEANPQPTDMTEFVQWAQSHDLFSLPAWDDSLPGNVPFEEIIMILDEQDEYGKAYQFPSGTPGAS